MTKINSNPELVKAIELSKKLKEAKENRALSKKDRKRTEKFILNKAKSIISKSKSENNMRELVNHSGVCPEIKQLVKVTPRNK